MTFVLMTDSTADLDASWIEEHDIEVVGLTIECNGRVYGTVGPNRLTSHDLLQKMKNGSQPTTSQINVGQFETVFRAYAEQKRDLLYFAFSSVLSGTYQSAVMAREIIQKQSLKSWTL